ncbi:hypothetical protein [Intestinibacillus sp. Marseille-P6563]|uniref:hypothetical protein n=1 Tax=Intestinibacillus sp. Marseille-P6563 TaxID=2364792 RepID=UPI000F061EE0|nr:hypothetical protein [Intestinibacillus sp. Marseille-P6563]
MNKNFTIPAFAEPITNLPDTPTCEATELKRRFQAPVDEVREAHNALAKAHETLDEKVEGIVTETFAGAITEDMLSHELSDSLARRSDLYFGTYTGDGIYPREITLGFMPRMVFITRADGLISSAGQVSQYLAFPVQNPSDDDLCVILQHGFLLTNTPNYSFLNWMGKKFLYVAVK